MRNKMNWWRVILLSLVLTTAVFAAPTVNLLSPQNGTGSINTTPTLKWSAAGTGAVSSTVYLDTDVDPFTGGTTYGAVSEESFTVTAALTPGTNYYWGVEVTDDGGTTRSVVQSFVVISCDHEAFLGAENPITTEVKWPNSVYSCDIDGDGDMDILSTYHSGWNSDSGAYVGPPTSWYENDGNENFTTHTIASDLASSIYGCDLDGDGDMDIISASSRNDKITWYENDGSENFTPHTVATNVDGAYSIYACDVDGDGDMDVLSASSNDSTIAWYENDGSESFTSHTISTDAPNAMSVYACDVDGDGDMDVLSASADDNKIAWYENDGNESFTTHTISNNTQNANSVYACDMDGDGDMDVLSSSMGNNVVWYENDGNQSFTPHTVKTGAVKAYAVSACDIDGDGDMDIFATLRMTGSYDATDVFVWYENDGSENFTTNKIIDDYESSSLLYASDIDGDGDMDVLSRSESGYLTWFKNRTPLPTDIMRGSGTVEDPYQIVTLKQLQNMHDDLTAHYVLMNDIDASDTRNWNMGAHDNYDSTAHEMMGFEPIGNDSTSFTGSLDGAGFIISNLFINRLRGGVYNGLIGYAENASVKSLGLENGSVSSSSEAGILMGFGWSCTVSQCYSTGKVSGFNQAGGLIGEVIHSTVSESFSTADVMGSSITGGLIAMNSNSTVSNCFSTGIVKGRRDVGGLVGWNTQNATVSKCYTSSVVTGTENIGGLAGANMQGASIGSSFFDSETSGISGGKSTQAMKTLSTFTNAGWDFENTWTITDGYPLLSFRTIKKYRLIYSSSEGGKVSGEILQNVNNGGVGSPVTAIADSGWYFYKWSDERRENPRSDNNVYNDISVSALFTNTPGDVPEFPAFITNVIELQSMRDGVDKYYRLANDIDASATNPASPNYDSSIWGAEGFEPIGDYGNDFTGTLNGAGFAVSHLYINRPDENFVGLIGNASTAFVDSLGVVNCKITGTVTTGALIGQSYSSTVSNSYSTGEVTGTNATGGLIGLNSNSTVKSSYSSAKVTGNEEVGGLIGESVISSTVSNCYSTGSVKGDRSIGGLIGRHAKSTVQNCYSTGIVTGNSEVGGLIGANPSSTVNNSVWDTQTSGTTVGVGVFSTLPVSKGKTTQQMKFRSTFTSEGWDFTKETSNGTDDIWGIDSGNYPHLVWSETNTAPVITSSITAEATELQQFSYTATATDKESTPVLSFENYPDWLTVTGSTISGTPAVGTTDTSFVVIAMDGEFSDTLVVSLAVAVLKITYSDRDSLTSDSTEHSFVTNNNPTGTMDTIVTTTVVDSIVDSTFHITDTYTDGVLTETAVDSVTVTKREEQTDQSSVTKPYQPKSTTIRDSVKSDSTEHTFVTDNSPTGTMDTIVTTTVVDSIVDSIWQITDTLQGGTLLNSSAPLFVRDSIWVDTISSSTETKEYEVPVAIEQIDVVQKTGSIIFAPNPVSLSDGEVFFAIPEHLRGEITVTIFDYLGNQIDSQKFEDTRGKTYRWDLRNEAGVQVASGTYVAVIEVESKDGSRNIVKRNIGVRK